MNIISLLRVAWDSIVANKMRTGLTMLGIIIGVASVIALVSIGQGTTASIKSSIESMGSNMVMVSIRGRGVDTTLPYDDCKELAGIDAVGAVAPVVSGSTTVKYGTESVDVSVEGVDYDYMAVRNRKVSAGRALGNLDCDNRLKTVVLGSGVVKDLFGALNPIGETVKLNGVQFTVTGVLESVGSSMSGSGDDVVLMPITTAQRFLYSAGISTVYVQAENSGMVDAAIASLEEYLNELFRDYQDAFIIVSSEEMLSTVSEISNTMSMLLGGIASISLLVGGIGIMNIMMVSVTERTREIGIRKAIGAKRRDILTQFLIEAAVVSGAGGIVGIILGWGAAVMVSYFGMETVVSGWIVIVAFIFSVGIGIFFGIYPANKAAGLNPVEALRSE